MMFGSLSKTIILRMGHHLTETVISNCIPKGIANDDAETRRYAIKSLRQMLKTLGIANVESSMIN